MAGRVESISPISKSVRLVVFDLDGTLADTFEDIARATNHVLTAFGCPTLPAEVIKTYVGRGARNLMARALGPANEAFADAAAVLWREYYEHHPADHTSLYPGAVELLEWLRARDVRTAILSNKMDRLTQIIAAQLGLAARVDFILGESDAFARKPDPAALNHVLSVFGIRREQTVVVGDGEPDVEFARNAGAAFCAVLTGQATRKDFEALGVAWIVENLEVLREQLEASGACTP